LVDQAVLILSLAALGFAFFALAVAAFSLLRIRSLSHRQASVADAVHEGNFAAVINKIIEDVEDIRRVNDKHDKAIKKTWRKTEGSVQRVAVVRYDALEELAGQLSFSAALLDDAADGVVITSINGRTDTRTYAKPIQRGESTFILSDEERRAITKAMAEGAGIGQ